MWTERCRQNYLVDTCPFRVWTWYTIPLCIPPRQAIVAVSDTRHTTRANTIAPFRRRSVWPNFDSSREYYLASRYLRGYAKLHP